MRSSLTIFDLKKEFVLILSGRLMNYENGIFVNNE